MAFFNEFPHTRTYDSDLGWIIKFVKHLLDIYNELLTNNISNKEEIKKLKKECENILQRLEKVENGEFSTEWLMQWVRTNIANIIYQIVPMFMFGLNEEGYFIADYPEGWDFINWFTSLNPASDDYGKLQLSY